MCYYCFVERMIILAYGALARYYDDLMSHVDYKQWADIMLSYTEGPCSALDLACGTGRFTEILVNRGYDMVATDSSEDMLSVASGKGINALFLCQSMPELDLYGTVKAAFCTLDGMNYLQKPSELQKTLDRVSLFLEPGGVFVFDMLSANELRRRNGVSFTSESSEAFCCWSCSFVSPLCVSKVDLFVRENALWKRFHERHAERAYEETEVLAACKKAGFLSAEVKPMPVGQPSNHCDSRLLYIARK